MTHPNREQIVAVTSPQNWQGFVCHFCGGRDAWVMADLGDQPLANGYLADRELAANEKTYPLLARVCTTCKLAQVDKVVPPEDIFTTYSYFSSFSSSWVEHARQYAEGMISAFGLNRDSLVMEIASNDGYLLQHFKARDVPILGIEPAANIAGVANAKGIRTISRFFGRDTARDLLAEGFAADLVAANNVLAHVPDINDFVSGLSMVLKARGVLTVEFHHLLSLIRNSQFDAIYHEHFSYLSLEVVERIFARHGLRIFDVEVLSTHGGSLRVYAHRADGPPRPRGKNLDKVTESERLFGLTTEACYSGFNAEVRRIKSELLQFLEQCRRECHQVVGYGAAAKGNTLLNYCGIKRPLLTYVVDKNPHKQDKLLPGSHIEIVAPERLCQTRPHYVLILPWNLADEIMSEHAYISEWGGKFIVAVPRMRVLT